MFRRQYVQLSFVVKVDCGQSGIYLLVAFFQVHRAIAEVRGRVADGDEQELLDECVTFLLALPEEEAEPMPGPANQQAPMCREQIHEQIVSLHTELRGARGWTPLWQGEMRGRHPLGIF